MRLRSLLIPLMSLMLVPRANASSPSAVRDNNQGIEYLKGEENYQAYQKFIEGLAKAPFQPELHLNLGLSFVANEEFEKALKEFKMAAKLAADNENLQFQALFNAAQSAGQEGDIAQALELYQQALELYPDSQEVKTNIELLWKGQQGKGKGKKENQDQKQKEDGQEQEQEGQGQKKKDQDQQGQPEQQKKQPKSFESRELSKDDVRKILEELKDQEQEIRAKQYDKGLKEAPNDKDW